VLPLRSGTQQLQVCVTLRIAIEYRWTASAAANQTISSEAVLPLPEPCVPALAEHRLMLERWRADAGEAWHENDLVVGTR
jgi:hypothetical protein